MKNYITNDIFDAAALALISGQNPNGYYTTGEIRGSMPVYYMVWDELPDEHIQTILAGQIMIDLPKYKTVYRNLRGELVKRSKEQDNAKRAATIKTG